MKAFINVMWFLSFLAFEQHIVEDPAEIDVNVSRSDFTVATAKLHELFTSAEFSHYLVCLFNVANCSPAQRSNGVQLAHAIDVRFLEHLQRITLKDQEGETLAFNVEEMSSVGRGKVRHVGGWAFRKVLENSRTYVRTNIHSENAETMSSVYKHHGICELIEEYLVGSLVMLEKVSLHKDTLQVTEARQFRERGLIHIEDTTYEFFMSLEGLRVQLLNNKTMREQKGNMAEVAYQQLLRNEELKLKWQKCFHEDDLASKKVRLLS